MSLFNEQWSFAHDCTLTLCQNLHTILNLEYAIVPCMDCEAGMANECIKLEDGSIKNFDRPERGLPLTKEYFCDILGFFIIVINFRSNKEDNQNVTTTKCNAKWGPHKGKDPYRYLQGSNLEMKARIKYLWPIMHQRPKEFIAISLAFVKGISVECKGLLVVWVGHATSINKL